MVEVFHNYDESILFIENWIKRDSKIVAGFTTKNGGVSHSPFESLNMGLHVKDEQDLVVKNREILASKIQFPLKEWVSGEQVHRTEIKVVDELDKGKGSVTYDNALKGIDGLITNKSGILCTAFFADCVPIYFFDPHSGYVGIAHAGWKGTVNRIAENMIKTFDKLGVKKDNILVTIGPSISKEVYEVDDNVVNFIPKEEQRYVVTSIAKNRYLLDLKQLNVEILLKSGVLRHNIDVTNYCTYLNNELFFSHRRDKGKTGRMLGFIGILP